ncbi:hypothetical protein C8Q78DRAFT_1010789 [Trametes maxima]|nr:hypothetical protein C8Q78DRAFT_1010789 [Trametes maxima]
MLEHPLADIVLRLWSLLQSFSACRLRKGQQIFGPSCSAGFGHKLPPGVDPGLRNWDKSRQIPALW